MQIGGVYLAIPYNTWRDYRVVMTNLGAKMPEKSVSREVDVTFGTSHYGHTA